MTQDYTDLRLTPQEAQERWEIQQSGYYKRLGFLGIKAKRDESGTYLSGEQVEILDKLDSHLKQGGKMEEFEFDSDSSEITISKKNSGVVTAKEAVEESTNNPDFEIMQRFDRSGQEEAAGILAQAKQHLVSSYIQNPNNLDQDLQKQLFENEPIEKINQQWAGKHLADAILTQKQMQQQPAEPTN